MKRKINLATLLGLVIVITFFILNAPFAHLYQQSFLVTMGILTLLWAFTLIIKDSSVIDIYWGFGFIVAMSYYLYALGEEYHTTRNLVYAILVSIWGMRLTFYLASRNIGKGEDYRYVLMRNEAGKNWWWLSYLRVFVLQGVLLWCISSVFLPALMAKTEVLSVLDYIGIAFWAIGLYFEAVGDWQLTQFKKNPANKGKVMDQGLWKYTRHPNYFGDAMIWIGFYLFALAYHNGFLWFLCPFLMVFLLVRVSGAAMLETGLKKTKPQYAEYIRKTSEFIPMPPKK